MPWTTETILKAIDTHGLAECVTEARLAELTGYTAKQVDNACQRLIRNGFLRRTGKGCHKLTDAGRTALAECAKLRSGPKGPQESGHRKRDRGDRQRIWNVLRIGRKVTVDEIIMRTSATDVAADDDKSRKSTRSNTLKYVQALCRAGYVATLARREAPLNLTSNGCKRYLLISDTGPDAPVVRVSRKALYDPNLEKEISLVRESDGAVA
jgi:DNA-binding MarR family transcriptional regulator